MEHSSCRSFLPDPEKGIVCPIASERHALGFLERYVVETGDPKWRKGSVIEGHRAREIRYAKFYMVDLATAAAVIAQMEGLMVLAKARRDPSLLRGLGAVAGRLLD